MEGKINTIEAMFSKTEADLNYALRRLDDENAKADEEEEQSGAANPVRLAQSLDAIKAEFSTLREEAVELEKSQREAAGVLQREMANLTAVLMQMQRQGVVLGGEEEGVDAASAAPAAPASRDVAALEAELARLTDSLPTTTTTTHKN